MAKTSLKEKYYQGRQISAYAKIYLKYFIFRQASFYSTSSWIILSALYLHHILYNRSNSFINSFNYDVIFDVNLPSLMPTL